MRSTLAALLFFATSTPATADDAAMRRCREQVDPAPRLACYDAIPIALSPAGSPAVKAAPAADFGRPAPAAAATSIETSVGSDFEGWRPNARIRLANAQVWQVIDDSMASMDRGPRKVTVRRGALGTYFLDFEGSNLSPRVRRVD